MIQKYKHTLRMGRKLSPKKQRSKLTLNSVKGGKKTEVDKIGAWFERERKP